MGPTYTLTWNEGKKLGNLPNAREANALARGLIDQGMRHVAVKAVYPNGVVATLTLDELAKLSEQEANAPHP